MLGLAAWAGLGQPSLAQQPGQVPRSGVLPKPVLGQRLPSHRLAPRPEIAALRADPDSRLGGDLQRLYTVGQASRSLVVAPQAASATFPLLRFSKDGSAVMVRITAQDVTALLPSLLSRGFTTVAAYPSLHFVEGLLPLGQLAAGSQGVAALAAQGLMGVVPAYRSRPRVGATASQGDITLEAARTRATRPKSLDGTGVRVGVLSDSFNALNGAGADIASGDLPASGVRVLLDDGTTDEGRAMCQIVHDLAPGSPLAFATANVSEADFAQQILNLADPAQGNCKVLVDDIGYFTEPFFQDGVIAQAITQAVSQGATYFSAAGNNGNNSYENAAPAFVSDARGAGRLNFATTGTADLTQRFVVADGYDLIMPLQWSDPFYGARGSVKTDLDMYLVKVRIKGNTAVQRGDTVASSTINNVSTLYPLELIGFSNDTSTTHTTAFDLHIVRRAGTANPTRLKYVVESNGASASDLGPTEYQTYSSTLVGHPAATAAMAVAAVPYFFPQVSEDYTALGKPTILFSPAGATLATPEVRQKPNFAAVDGVNTSFFGTSADDIERDGYPNFFGTSAAAPHAAAVAALLQQSEPALTPTQVYARLTATARLVGATTTDPLTGAGLLDAFTAVYGPAVATTPPAAEDLEKGALPTSWTVASTGAGRVQVTNALSPASGTQHLLLDSYPGVTSIKALNEATWYFTGVSATNALLTFRERKFAAETDDAMPAKFLESYNADGVAMSVDGGTTWYRIFDLTGTNATTTYQTKSVNLTQFATTNNLTLGNDVRLRFQQYGTGAATGNTASSRAGRVFDDIALTGLTPAPVALYTSSQPTVGCPGLAVQFADSSLFKPTAYNWTFAGGTPATATTRAPAVVYNTPGRYAVTLSVTNANGTVARTDTGYVVVYGRTPLATVTPTFSSICPGATVTFTSTATYCPGTYAWSFPGGSPASSSAQNPGAITYATAGNYVATLTVSNAYGSTTTSIPVAVGGRALPVAETFDNTANAQTLPTGWSIVNPDRGVTWSIAEGIIGRNGQASRVLRAPFWFDTNVGEHDAVYTPAISLAGTSAPTLLFDLAYGKVDDTKLDSLSVQIADACTGAILGKPYAKGSAGTLPTTTPKDQTVFVPTSAAEWRQERVDLTPYAGRSVVIRFVGRNGLGQYLYLDNVQVGNNLLALSAAASLVGLEAWPNPLPSGTGLSISLPAYSGTVSLRLVDNLGRTVWQEQVQQTGAALQKTATLPFAPGLYNLLYTPATGTPAARRIVLR